MNCLRALLLLLVTFSTGAQSASADGSSGDVRVCPARDDTPSPPSDFDAADCVRMHLSEVDPQGRQLWLRLSLPVSAGSEARIVGLLIAAKAASEIHLNGVLLGRSGVPSASAEYEVAGAMDSVLRVEPEQVRAGENTVEIRISSHLGWLRLRSPIHGIALVTHADPQDATLRHYLPALLPLGTFLLALFYFLSLTLRAERKAEPALFAALAGLAGLQLLLEVARGVFAYAYPIHDLRLIGILDCSLLFGICLAAILARLFAPKWLLPLLLLSVVAMGLAIVSVAGLDAKTSLTLLVATLVSLAIACVGMHGRVPGARAYAGALLLFALTNVLAPDAFLDRYFYFMVAALMVLLMVLHAIAFARERRVQAELRSRADRLQQALDQNTVSRSARVISVPGTGTMKQIDVERVVRVQGADDYVELCLDDDSRHLHSATLNLLESELPPIFLRVHRSHIVNTRFIDRLERSDSGTGTLYLRNGASVPVSRRVMPGVRKALK